MKNIINYLYKKTTSSSTKSTTLSRRFLTTLLATALVAGVAMSVGQYSTNIAQAAGTQLSKSDFAKLSAYNHLPIGNPNATVTVYEFSSLTCPHCAAFQATVLPKIKKKYIDTGKIKWQMVDFPLDNVAYGAAVMARCMTDKARYNGLLDTLFKTQSEWASNQDPKAGVMNVMARAGVDSKAAEACLKNKKNLADVAAARKLGEALGINSTPTFFVMDQMVENNEKKLLDTIDKALK
ncbi:MAG: DsbA family protein [Hydrotalea sp.]|nr:DsbA family protein [Hydrotalea sp.]